MLPALLKHPAATVPTAGTPGLREAGLAVANKLVGGAATFELEPRWSAIADSVERKVKPLSDRTMERMDFDQVDALRAELVALENELKAQTEKMYTEMQEEDVAPMNEAELERRFLRPMDETALHLKLIQSLMKRLDIAMQPAVMRPVDAMLA